MRVLNPSGHEVRGRPRRAPQIASLILLAGAWPGLRDGAVAGAAEAGSPAAPSAAQAEAPSPSDPCADPGQSLLPVRVQIGTVEAVVTLGKDLLLPVRIKGVCNLARFSFSLSYNSQVIHLVRVEQTPFLAGDPPVEVGFVGLQKGAPSLFVQGARLPGTGGVSGVGTLARLVLRAAAVGDTDINLVRLELEDAAGKVIPVEAFPVHVTVVATQDPSAVLRKGTRLPD